jgi:hypothetical protein
MPRALVAAIVMLLVAVTPSLALACDARCLADQAALTGGDAGASGHAAHRSSHAQTATAHTHHTAAAPTSDAIATIHVTAFVTAALIRHGCLAAFDAGTLDRQPGNAGGGDTTAGVVFVYPSSPGSPCPRAAALAPTMPASGRASTPLRI